MRWQDFPLPDGCYSDETRPFTQQDVVNYLPTFAEAAGTRSALKHTCVPGLYPFATVGDGPHRGGRDVEGKAFVVSGTSLFQVHPDGTSTNLGTIPGTAMVSMTHNQVSGGNELVIGTGDNSYVYNTATEVLAATGVALSSVDFLGQLILGIEPQRRFWRYSALVDATSYSSLDVESAESSPDRIVGGIVSQGEWLVLGERTIEVWRNSPNASTAFQRGEVIERGCANANTIRRLDNSVFFVGNDLIPYQLRGYTPIPIASKAIVGELAQCDPQKMFAFTWEDRGYVAYYLTCQDGHTWGFDVTSRRWHRRESFGLDRWRLNTLFKWNDKWYGGDYSNGKLHELRWLYPYEGCEIMPRRLRTGVMHSMENQVSVHGLKLLVNTGVDEASPCCLSLQGALPDGLENLDYEESLTISGGTAPYVVSVYEGALPSGGTAAVDGDQLVFAWTAPASGDYSFRVRLTDANGCEATYGQTVSVAIAARFLVSPNSAAGTDFVLRSINGLAWTDNVDTGLGLNVSRLFSLNRKVFAFPVDGNSDARVTADGGDIWSAVTGLPTTAKNGMTYAESGGVGRYLVFLSAGASAYVSTDGDSFTSFAVESRTYYNAATLGETVVVMSSLGALIRSTNGGATFSASFSNGVGLCEHIIATPTAFIGASSNPAVGIIRSTTGASGSWAQVATGNGNAGGLAYGDGRIMKLGENGESSYSDNDGLSFVAGPTIPGFNTGGALNSNLGFGSGLFVAVGNTQQIWTTPSTGTPVWTQRKVEADPPTFEEIVSVTLA